jgi:CRP-like cAMP-binding protein
VDNQTIYILKGDVQLTSSTQKNETTIRSNAKEARFPLDDSQPRQCSAVAMSSVELVRVDNSVLDYMMMWDQLAVAEISESETAKSNDEKLVEQAVLDSIADAKEPDKNLDRVDKVDFTKTIKPELSIEQLETKKRSENKKEEKTTSVSDSTVEQSSKAKNQSQNTIEIEKFGAKEVSENKKEDKSTEISDSIDKEPQSVKNQSENNIVVDNNSGKKDSENKKEDKSTETNNSIDNEPTSEINKDDRWKKKSNLDSNAQTTVNDAIKIKDKTAEKTENSNKDKSVVQKENQQEETTESKLQTSENAENKKNDTKSQNRKVQNIKPDTAEKDQNTIIYESRDWIRKIRQIMAFKNMPPANIKNLLERMESVEVKKGEKIIEQGGEGDYYYIVTDGTAVVTRTIELASLSAGTSFGEEALVAKSPRNASVTMTSDGILMRLSKTDFDELLIEPLMARVSPDEARLKILQGAKWLDVRHAKEFHHSRLPGAINIPLHELRLRMAELDKETEYICCCRTGARSSSGSFLLAQNGFKVSLLTGGIQVMSQDLRR